MSKINLLAIILMIISWVTFISIMIYGTIEYEGNMGTTKIIQGDCYDKYNNKINEVTCAVEVIDEYDLILFIGFPISIFMIGLSLALFLFANGRKSDE